MSILVGGVFLSKENSAVRRAARAAGVPYWKIAAAIGVSEPTIIRWLRVPLSEDRKRQIMAAISELAESGD